MTPKRQLIDVLNLATKEALANLHTTTIAKVTAINDKTINVRPVINREVNGVSIDLPEFVEVPPIFMQGGASYTAYPIAVDDYCLLIITERCFDRWYAGQDFISPAEFRMHDYSDGFAIVGVNPLSTAISIPTTIQRVGDYTQTGDVIHIGDYEQTGNMTIVGDLKVTGAIDCIGSISATVEMTANGIDLSTHTHNYYWTGVPGSDVTGAPN